MRRSGADERRYESQGTVADEHRLVYLWCWAHAQRYLHSLQALPEERRGPAELSARVIALIGELYNVESDGWTGRLAAPALRRKRQERSVGVLAEIEQLLL